MTGLLLLVALVVPLTMAAEPAVRVPRVAILAAAAQRGLADLLTAELSQQRNLALVERDAIDRVLNELSLAAVQAGEGEQGVKLGELLAADALLSVEPEPQSEPPQVRLKLVETRTGIRLGDWPVPAAQIGAGHLADVLASLRQAAAKLGVPPGDRHLVGVIGIQPEAATVELATLARALTVLVERDLAALPDVVVLDRDQLRRLTAERDLTGLELDMRVSSKLIEGSIRPEGDRLTIALKLVPLTGGEGRTATLATGGGLPAIRRDVATTLADSLGAEPPGLPAAAPADESTLLADRARQRTSFRDHEEAIRLAEAAFVLAPGPGTFSVLYHAFMFSEQDIYAGAWMLEKRPDFSSPWFDRERYPTVEAARIARQAVFLRLAEATRAYYEHCTKDPALESAFPLHDPGLLFLYRIPTESEAERRLAADRDRIQRETYARILAVRRAAGSPGATNLILHRLARIDWLLSGAEKASGQALVDFLQDIQEELAREEQAGRWPADRRGSLAVYYDLLRRALHEQFGGGVPADTIRPYLESLATSDDAGLRIIGWSRLLELPGDVGAAAAERLLDTLLFADVPRRRPNVRPPSDSTATFKGLGVKAGKRLAATGRLTAYLERIVSRAETDGDASRLIAAPSDLIGVIRCDQPRAEEFLRRIETLIDGKAYPPDKAPAIESFVAALADGRAHRRLLHALDTRTGPYAPAPAGRLDGYEVRELQLASPEPGFTHVARVHVDRSSEGDPRRPLVLVWSKHVARLWSWRKDDPREFDYLLCRMGTDGGGMKVEGRCRLPDKAIQCMASAGERHFFATEQHGVAVVSGRDLRMITQADGVPAGWISALAWLDGRLYLAHENSLVEANPDTKRCNLIASARSQASRNPLDGVGPFTITGLTADPPRKRLVILATSTAPAERSPAGLWSFTPDGGTWRRLAAAGCFGLVWGKEAMFFGRRDSQNEVPYRLDLATSRITPLPGYAKAALPHGDERGEPGWTIHDDLLFFPNSTRAAARDASGIEHSWSQGPGSSKGVIYPVGDELVVFDESSCRLTVIRRKPSPSGQNPTP